MNIYLDRIPVNE